MLACGQPSKERCATLTQLDFLDARVLQMAWHNCGPTKQPTHANAQRKSHNQCTTKCTQTVRRATDVCVSLPLSRQCRWRNAARCTSMPVVRQRLWRGTARWRATVCGTSRPLARRGATAFNESLPLARRWLRLITAVGALLPLTRRCLRCANAIGTTLPFARQNRWARHCRWRVSAVGA